jgi:1,4-dihydroxy-2-naphthoate polyprenyltransferase
MIIAGERTAVRWATAVWRALRPFSFSVAFVSCLLGVVLARSEGTFDVLEAAGVIVAGLLFQSGVNLVNDFFEFKQHKLDDKNPDLHVFGGERTALEWFLFASGLACFLLIAPIGLWLVSRAGLPLLWLGLLGVAGAYFYTGEPFNYKRRGLAVVLVFFLMGVLMIAGSHFAIAHRFSIDAVWSSIPISALVSLLLLSNELRDAEDDARHGIRTLTVRIGYEHGVTLYYALIALAYGSALGLWVGGLLPHPYFVLASIAALPAPLGYLRAAREERRPLTPLTARFHLVFGLLYTLTFV